MNLALELAGFRDTDFPGWMSLELKTPHATLRTYANELAPPQFLLGVQGEPDPALLRRLLAALERVRVDRDAGAAFALPAGLAPFDRLGFVRGPERRLLRGVLEDDDDLQAWPMFACELTGDGRLPPLGNFRRWTNVLALDRAPQPWFHFRLRGRPSGLEAAQWQTEAWPTFRDYVAILARDADAWLEVRNRQGRIFRLPDAAGWERALERVETHVCRDALA